MKTKQLATDAMLCAMCAVLGYLSIDLGNLKFSFETLPILMGALLFGPADGLLIGGVGTGIYQLLRYGISATTLLWMLPYALCGWIVGFTARKNGFVLGQGRLVLLVVLNELLITALNTGVLYLDSVIYGYYSPVYIFGTLVPRLVICVGRALAFSLILPSLLKPAGRVIVRKRT